MQVADRELLVRDSGSWRARGKRQLLWARLSMSPCHRAAASALRQHLAAKERTLAAGSPVKFLIIEGTSTGEPELPSWWLCLCADGRASGDGPNIERHAHSLAEVVKARLYRLQER